MSEQSRRDIGGDPAPTQSGTPEGTKITDAVRHVGPTLESEGQFVPTGDLPENQIANAAGSRAVNLRETTADPLDREAEAMGAERLKTRLPGDRSSDPHTDVAEEVERVETERRNQRDRAA